MLHHYTKYFLDTTIHSCEFNAFSCKLYCKVTAIECSCFVPGRILNDIRLNIYTNTASCMISVRLVCSSYFGKMNKVTKTPYNHRSDTAPCDGLTVCQNMHLVALINVVSASLNIFTTSTQLTSLWSWKTTEHSNVLQPLFPLYKLMNDMNLQFNQYFCFIGIFWNEFSAHWERSKVHETFNFI